MFILIQTNRTSISSDYGYLHSTMFILILTFCIALAVLYFKFTFHDVYINTFLPEYHCIQTLQFTFHDVYINTPSVFFLDFFCYYLHSTMFILIHRLNHVQFINLINLHSTMFILIQIIRFCHLDSSYIYIPRCLY